MTHLLSKTCLLSSLGLITQLDHDHIIVSPSALEHCQWFTGSGHGCLEHPKTVSKLYIFPNIFKMKRLSCSPHSVHFAVGVTRLKDVSGTF